MIKHLKHRDGEPLSEWVDRIAAWFCVNWEVHEAMSEISKQSYIVGSNDAAIARRDIPERGTPPSEGVEDFTPF